MKSISKFIWGVLIVSLMSGCVSSSSYVLVGTQRPKIDPSQVKIYLHPPAKYEEVALVSGDSRYTFVGDSGQTKMNIAMKHLKEEAASLGANGILLTGTGDQYGGSVGSSFGSATAFGSANQATSFGSGVGYSAPIQIKAASGMAIYVTQE